MEINTYVRTWGNSAGVLLSREWLGKEVKVILINRTLEIKKEILNILDNILEDIIGIYLVGSYARGEQTEESDVDIIAISNKTKKEIISDKYHISIIPLESIKKSLLVNPIVIYPRLIEAKSLINNKLLEELTALKLKKSDFKYFIEETKRILKINKKFINLDEIDGEYLESSSVVYSLILRLRGVFIIKSILDKKQYTNKLFKEWLIKKNIGEEDTEKIYKIYRNIRDNKKIKVKIKLEKIKNLLKILEDEINSLKE